MNAVRMGVKLMTEKSTASLTGEIINLTRTGITIVNEDGCPAVVFPAVQDPVKLKKISDDIPRGQIDDAEPTVAHEHCIFLEKVERVSLLNGCIPLSSPTEDTQSLIRFWERQIAERGAHLEDFPQFGEAADAAQLDALRPRDDDDKKNLFMSVVALRNADLLGARDAVLHAYAQPYYVVTRGVAVLAKLLGLCERSVDLTRLLVPAEPAFLCDVDNCDAYHSLVPAYFIFQE